MSDDSETPEDRHRVSLWINGGGQGLSVRSGLDSIAQGLRIIGYGFIAIAVSIVLAVGMVVTYWNAQ